MRYTFLPYNQDVLFREWKELGVDPCVQLAAAIKVFSEQGEPLLGCVVSREQGRVKKIKRVGFAGRALYAHTGKHDGDAEILVMLKVYKKTGPKTPRGYVKTALARLGEYES